MSQLLDKYLNLRKKHILEINNFPIKFAFSDEQLKDALKELDADINDCTSVVGIGDVIRKKDVPNYIDMLKQQKDEIDELTKDHELMYEAFLYEMDNHEYAINWEGDAEVLGCFGMNERLLEEKGLLSEYRRAQSQHYKKMMENGVI